MATVAARRLGLLDSPFTVVLGGGVLRARHPLLLDAVHEQLQPSAPKAIDHRGGRAARGRRGAFVARRPRRPPEPHARLRASL